ncbi:MAG TPA: phosphate signaling complex protein PhoU [Actinomycetota bacterium]|nr:phosphate signaling complex protein PhoU [Actinomycetota bacterium]
MPARVRFHEELEQLELQVLGTGELAERAVGRAVDALVRRDAGEALAVVAADDEVDARYLDTERRALELLALQTPVAVDLRLISAILHANLHLERVADIAVNIAKISLSVRHLPSSSSVLAHLHEMGDIGRGMLRTALEAFARRDLALCLRLPRMDDPVDRLNLRMYGHVAALAGDPAMLEWGLRMTIVARQLERVADHAVDIAEQVGFLLTGEFREFTDASHPEATGG